MFYTYRIWDKTSPINGCPADEAVASLNVTDDKQLCILSNDQGRDCITQTFPSTASATDIKTWVDNFNSEMAAHEKAAAIEAAKPTLEQRIKQLEAGQLNGLGV